MFREQGKRVRDDKDRGTDIIELRDKAGWPPDKRNKNAGGMMAFALPALLKLLAADKGKQF